MKTFQNKSYITLIIFIILAFAFIENLFAATGTFHQKNDPWPNKTIPDNGGYYNRVNLQINVSGIPSNATIKSVKYTCWVDHTYRGDLCVDLTAYISNQWVSHRISDREGGSGDNVDKTEGPFTTFNGGCVSPDNPSPTPRSVTSFNPNGQWYLVAWDNAPGDEGALDGIELWIEWVTPEPPPGAPGTPDLAAEDDTGYSNSDNITYQTTGLTFSWSAASGTVERYYYGWNTSTPSSSYTTSRSVDVSAPSGNGNHTFYVRGWNSQGGYGPSSSLTVYIDRNRPYITNLDLRDSDDSGKSSTDNITNDTNVRFTWTGNTNGGSGIRRYWYGWTTAANDASTTNTYADVSPPSNNGTYTFYVGAEAVSGLWAYYPDYTDQETVTWDTTAPLPPTLSSPSEWAETANTTPTLQWQAVPGAWKYRVYVREDHFPYLDSRESSEITSTSWTVSPSLGIKNWGWQVKVWDIAGNQGSYGRNGVVGNWGHFTVYSTNLINGVPGYDQTSDDCGPVAAAKVLAYWERHSYGGIYYWNIIDNGDDNSGDVTPIYGSQGNTGLVAKLRETSGWIEGVGTRDDKLADGIEIFCNNSNYSNNLNFNANRDVISPSYSTLMSEIDAGKPLVYFMTNHSTYGHHFVTAVGYKNSDTDWVLAKDNWDGDDIQYIDWAEATFSIIKVTPGGTPSDHYENDDQSSLAQIIDPTHQFRFRQTHNFYTTSDSDWMKFTTQPSKKYTIESKNLGSQASTRVYVYKAGNLSSPYAKDSDGGTAKIILGSLQSETFYIWVTNANSNSGPHTNYDIEVDDQNLSVTGLTSGNGFSSTVSSGDWRFFSISVPAGNQRLDVQTTSATGDVDIYILRSDLPSRETGYFNASAATSSGNELATVTSPASGTYYVGIYGKVSAGFAITATIVPMPPATPASITYPTSDSDGSYIVSWSSSTGATSYQLERSNNGGSTWSQIYSGANTSYTENVGNGSYRYRVKATNSGGSSGWRTGTSDCVVSIPTPPDPPSSITYPTSDSDGSYTVSWSSSTGATSYQLERSSNGGSTWTQIYSGSGTSYPENVGNGSYRYRVKATNTAGSSGWRTGTSDCVVSIPTPPDPPASIAYPTSDSDGSYAVSWSSSTGATSYQLERSNNGGGTWSPIYSGASTSYGENIGNGSYRYRVKASNTAGSSGWRTGTSDCVVNIPTRIIRLEGNLAFGNVTVGQSAQRTMKVYNDGNTILLVSSISCPTGFNAIPQSFPVPANGGSQDVTITFSPTAVTSYGSSIIVNSDKTSGTDTIPCSGTGVLLEYTISVSAGANGTVNPAGDVPVSQGENLMLTATSDNPNAYTVAQWLVDGVVAQIGLNEFTLTNIQANHNVEVTFMPIPTIVYVNVYNTTEPWEGTQDNPYQHIQDGINVSSDGTKIIVMQGTYLENVSIKDKNLTLVGQGNPSNNWNTMVMADIYDCGLPIIKIIDSNVTLDGLNITGNFMSWRNYNYGVGIGCVSERSQDFDVEIRNCRIANNMLLNYGNVDPYGAGIYGDSYAKLKIIGNTIEDNQIIQEEYKSWNAVFKGAGVYSDNAYVKMINNKIINNKILAEDWLDQDGFGGTYYGAGVYVQGGEIIKNEIANNIIEINGSPRGSEIAGYGGGIYSSGPVLVEDNIISGNSIKTNQPYGEEMFWFRNAISVGAGLYTSDSVVLRNIIVNNQLQAKGGDEGCLMEGCGVDGGEAIAMGAGVYCQNSIIQNNTIYNNTLSSVAGIGGHYIWDWENQWEYWVPEPSPSIAEGAGLYSASGVVELSNNIVWSNSLYGAITANHNNVQGGYSGIDNIDIEPLFANPSNGDFHLKSEYGRWNPNGQTWEYDLVTSPCIDAGDPADSNWKNELWPHGKRINMGAYGGTPEASMSPNPMGNVADINRNDCVGVEDLMLFVEKWLIQDVLLAEDMDLDNQVDLADFSIFAENWSYCPGSDIVGYWQFNETSGTQAQDSSIYGNHGTLINGPVWTGDGKLSFDGIDDYVSVADSTSLDITNQITISIWIYMDQYSTDWPKLVIKPYDTATDPWELYTLDMGRINSLSPFNVPRFILTDGTPSGNLVYAFNNSYTLTLNQWHHIVGTYDGATISLYVDGALTAYNSGSIQIGTNNLPLSIGGRLGLCSFKGLIDEVKIYNRGLTAGEVQNLYQNH